MILNLYYINLGIKILITIYRIFQITPYYLKIKGTWGSKWAFGSRLDTDAINDSSRGWVFFYLQLFTHAKSKLSRDPFSQITIKKVLKFVFSIKLNRIWVKAMLYLWYESFKLLELHKNNQLLRYKKSQKFTYFFILNT